MAKRELGGKRLSNVPVVMFKEKPGCKFVGLIKNNAPTKYGLVFNFEILDGDAPIKQKDPNTDQFVDTPVKVGDLVAVFASGQLKEKLVMAQPNEKIEIEFVGKKLNPKSGRYFNDFIVHVIE